MSLEALTVGVGVIGVVVAIITLIVQNRQSQFASKVELLLQFERQFESEEMRRKRRAAAAALQAGDFVPAEDVLDFFEMVGLLIRRNALDEEMVWHAFGRWALLYHHAALPHIENKKVEDKTAWSELCFLYVRMEKREMRFRGRTDLRHFYALEQKMLEAETRLP